jgi:hypothetical protein
MQPNISFCSSGMCTLSAHGVHLTFLLLRIVLQQYFPEMYQQFVHFSVNFVCKCDRRVWKQSSDWRKIYIIWQFLIWISIMTHPLLLLNILLYLFGNVMSKFI